MMYAKKNGGKSRRPWTLVDENDERRNVKKSVKGRTWMTKKREREREREERDREREKAASRGNLEAKHDDEREKRMTKDRKANHNGKETENDKKGQMRRWYMTQHGCGSWRP